MSQHANNFTIPNQTFPAFRTDLNSALQALVTSNSGTTAPATPFANQVWADTSAALLKIRNQANSAWITIGALDVANLGHALLASPTFTGVPAVPTAAAGTNTTQIASTAMVQAAIANMPTWTAPTLLNSWINYATAPVTNTGYRKSPTGLVEIKGQVYKFNPAPDEVLFQLPAGFRPSDTRYYSVFSRNPSVTSYTAVLYVSSIGEVRWTVAGGYVGTQRDYLISFDNVKFFAEA